MDVVVLGNLKKYIQETLIGMGALKGAACQIKEIDNDDGTHTITFLWEDNEGESHESSVVVKDGKDGAGGSSALVDLTDVSLTDLANEQILYYDSTSQTFKNITAGAVAETDYSAIQTLLS